MIITLTTVENQKNNTNINGTLIDLKECETSLRNAYNIPENEYLFIKKIDIIQDGMKIPKIEYDVYYKSHEQNGTRLKRLNISEVCSENSIDLSIPIILPENLDKLNMSAEYYNDICNPTTSEKGTDISLNDRRKMFVENNETICQEDCYFSEYDRVNQRATCSCKAKDSAPSFIDMNINITKIYQQFKDIKNIINLNILKCYKKLFFLEGIKNNICFFLIFPFIIFHIIVIIIFYCNQEKKLYKKIKDIKFAIKNWHLVKKEEKKLETQITKSEIKTKKNEDNSKSRTRNFFKTKKHKKIKTTLLKKVTKLI